MPAAAHAPAIAFPRLAIVDPDLVRRIRDALADTDPNLITPELVDRLETETLWGLAEDLQLGEMLAEGYARLIGRVSEDRLDQYREVTRSACRKGLNLGRMMARYWVPVLRHGDADLITRFSPLVAVLLKNGEYTMKRPLDTLSQFLAAGDRRIALGYMGLLTDTFSHSLPYKQSLYLARVLPQAVAGFPEEKRSWQISQLRRIIRTDADLADPFLKAMEQGLSLLREPGLKQFIQTGLDHLGRDPDAGRRFLALESRVGLEAFQALLVTVSLPMVREGLNQYVKARTGMAIRVGGVSDLPAALIPDPAPWVALDPGHIYLPGEISHFPDRQANAALYKCLCKLESAQIEFGTYTFDLDRARERWPEIQIPATPDDRTDSEMAGFWAGFDLPALAADLFTLFEHARLRVLLEAHYPGIPSRCLPLLRQEADRMAAAGKTGNGSLFALYRLLALGERDAGGAAHLPPWAADLERELRTAAARHPEVETTAVLVWRAYERLAPLAPEGGLRTPFNRRLHPDIYFRPLSEPDRLARRIRAAVRRKGLKVYRSELREHLSRKQGDLSTADLTHLVLSASAADAPAGLDLSDLDLEEILGREQRHAADHDPSPDPVFWYPEWHDGLGDYLHQHTRVSERPVPVLASDFYQQTLNRRQGLVSSLRRAFEMMRPERLTILRNWVEGDDFDYRGLLDFALDKRAGLMPSDRIYIKRIKHHRDVAVMLLVDLSRSTANPVFGSTESVLDLEKEAIVLFCEALQVVGDRFAISGFSGTSRLGVDFFWIKGFEETVSETVMHRIHGISPQRSTRMGAAIRHAAAAMEAAAARVRILIVLSDGFPNDVDYKRGYAIADTRKAMNEVRARGIHARAITVNIVGDTQLDALYGRVHHNVISDVRELPGKLLRIYGALTR